MPFPFDELAHLAGPTIVAIWCIGTLLAASTSGVWWLLKGRHC